MTSSSKETAAQQREREQQEDRDEAREIEDDIKFKQKK